MMCTLPSTAFAGDKPCITFKAPPSTEDDRPVIVAVTMAPQGTDYGFKIDFNKAPWGDECRNRCANATVFLDTDDDRQTGLKLEDPQAQQTGADLAIVIQGLRDYRAESSLPTLKVKVRQFNEQSTSSLDGSELLDLEVRRDAERFTAKENSILLLVDTNVGSITWGRRVRAIYIPPESKALVGYGAGKGPSGSGRVEVFKGSKLSNPLKKAKKKKGKEELKPDIQP
jgi:hypothetical protein